MGREPNPMGWARLHTHTGAPARSRRLVAPPLLAAQPRLEDVLPQPQLGGGDLDQLPSIHVAARGRGGGGGGGAARSRSAPRTPPAPVPRPKPPVPPPPPPPSLSPNGVLQRHHASRGEVNLVLCPSVAHVAQLLLAHRVDLHVHLPADVRRVVWGGVAWRGVVWGGVAWGGVGWRGVGWCGMGGRWVCVHCSRG